MSEDPKLNCVGCDTGLPFNEGEKLLVNGQLVEVAGLEEIMEEVRRLKISKRKLVADELLSRAKARQVVPEGSERQYRDALMDEYDRRYLGVM
ncbi:MAG TPA: hypothetical protein PLR51_01715 [Methanomassiliicoccales archaeon]|jgi:hypothetical protein|nr:hypothetical protein [Methanomassiliicoccales archaeon]HQQ24979.1 hypothetical protein [Methanomassiliicoccales archaeon]